MNIIHTMASEARTTSSPKRRLYSPELKLQVIAACAQPGASIAGVALQHGINANIVHRWMREHGHGTLIRRQPTFVPVTLSATHRTGHCLAHSGQPYDGDLTQSSTFLSKPIATCTGVPPSN